jgi:hypothetical protein
MNKLLAISLLSVLWLTGCKPFTPEETPEANTPIFVATGSIDGVSSSFAADGESFNAESTQENDSLNVLTHQGLLENAQSNTPALEVIFRSFSNTNTDLIAILNKEDIPVRHVSAIDSKAFYLVLLSADFIGDPQSISWEVLGETYSGNNIEIEAETDPSITRIPVSIFASFVDGCQSTLIDTVYLPNHGCDAHIAANMIDSAVMEYSANAIGGTGYTYAWEFIGGQKALSRDVKLFYAQPIIDKESVLLKVSNENNTVFKKLNFALTGNASCAINLNYSITPFLKSVPGVAQADYGQVVINYYVNSTRFSSENIVQPSDREFKVISYEEYVDEFAPEKTYLKVNMKFTGLLSDGGRTIIVKDLVLTLPFEL